MNHAVLRSVLDYALRIVLPFLSAPRNRFKWEIVALHKYKVEQTSHSKALSGYELLFDASDHRQATSQRRRPTGEMHRALQANRRLAFGKVTFFILISKYAAPSNLEIPNRAPKCARTETSKGGAETFDVVGWLAPRSDQVAQS
jgi:hypothetical protein